jgi:hypothetical protein
MMAGIFGAVLAVLVILFIRLVSIRGQQAPPVASEGDGPGVQPAPTRLVNAITHLSSSAFADAGPAVTSSGPYTGSLTTLKSKSSLTLNGNPLIAYIGSDFCPYCAATRWPLAVALARFGTCKGLHITVSGSAPEIYQAVYDFLPYVSSTYEGGIPFVDFGSKLVEIGAFIDPSMFAGFTRVQIAQGPLQRHCLASTDYPCVGKTATRRSSAI